MLEHPAIADCAVVGVPGDRLGEQVACLMRSSGPARPSYADLKALARERMAPQKTPVFWVWVDEWPLTGSGKIRKFQLREMFERGEYDDQTIDRAPVAGHDQPT